MAAMLAAPVLADAPCRTDVLARHGTGGLSGPRDVAVYGPRMGIETVVLLFVWLVIAESRADQAGQRPGVDTVGAGDAAMGALIFALADAAALSTATMATLSDETWREILRVMTTAGAMTCERSGADPPTAAGCAPASAFDAEGRSRVLLAQELLRPDRVDPDHDLVRPEPPRRGDVDRRPGRPGRDRRGTGGRRRSCGDLVPFGSYTRMSTIALVSFDALTRDVDRDGVPAGQARRLGRRAV